MISCVFTHLFFTLVWMSKVGVRVITIKYLQLYHGDISYFLMRWRCQYRYKPTPSVGFTDRTVHTCLYSLRLKREAVNTNLTLTWTHNLLEASMSADNYTTKAVLSRSVVWQIYCAFCVWTPYFRTLHTKVCISTSHSNRIVHV